MPEIPGKFASRGEFDESARLIPASRNFSQTEDQGVTHETSHNTMANAYKGNLSWQDWYGGLVYARLLHTFFMHQSTLCVNSFSHGLGSQPYDGIHSATDHLSTSNYYFLRKGIITLPPRVSMRLPLCPSLVSLRPYQMVHLHIQDFKPCMQFENITE
jgi:hypothetical protein